MFSQDFPNHKKRFQLNYILFLLLMQQIKNRFYLNDNQFIPSIIKYLKLQTG
jgi:hypothetical protein